jgi:cell division protein FtsL
MFFLRSPEEAQARSIARSLSFALKPAGRTPAIDEARARSAGLSLLGREESFSRHREDHWQNNRESRDQYNRDQHNGDNSAERDDRVVRPLRPMNGSAQSRRRTAGSIAPGPGRAPSRRSSRLSPKPERASGVTVLRSSTTQPLPAQSPATSRGHGQGDAPSHSVSAQIAYRSPSTSGAMPGGGSRPVRSMRSDDNTSVAMRVSRPVTTTRLPLATNRQRSTDEAMQTAAQMDRFASSDTLTVTRSVRSAQTRPSDVPRGTAGRTFAESLAREPGRGAIARTSNSALALAFDPLVERQTSKPEPRKSPLLRVMADPIRKPRSRVMPLAILTIGLLLAIGTGAVTLHASLAERQIKIDKINVEIDQQQRLNQRLRVEVAALSAPDRIVTVAEGLGLQAPQSVRFLAATSSRNPMPLASTTVTG